MGERRTVPFVGRRSPLELIDPPSPPSVSVTTRRPQDVTVVTQRTSTPRFVRVLVEALCANLLTLTATCGVCTLACLGCTAAVGGACWAVLVQQH